MLMTVDGIIDLEKIRCDVIMEDGTTYTHRHVIGGVDSDNVFMFTVPDDEGTAVTIVPMAKVKEIRYYEEESE